MFWGTVELVAHEQHLDHLRRAEREHLADEVDAQQNEGGWWQSLRQALAGQPSESRQSGGTLVEKTA
ncbi:MAG: hypothetical protein Kow0031_20950 [Anaerolineae bacterium]